MALPEDQATEEEEFDSEARFNNIVLFPIHFQCYKKLHTDIVLRGHSNSPSFIWSNFSIQLLLGFLWFYFVQEILRDTLDDPSLSHVSFSDTFVTFPPPRSVTYVIFELPLTLNYIMFQLEGGVPL